MRINMTTVDALTAFWNGEKINQTSKAFDDLQLIKSVPELKHLGDFACKHGWFLSENEIHACIMRFRNHDLVVVPYYYPKVDHIRWQVQAFDPSIETLFRCVAKQNAHCIKGIFFDVTTRCMIRYLSDTTNVKPFLIPLDTTRKEIMPSLSYSNEEV